MSLWRRIFLAEITPYVRQKVGKHHEERCTVFAVVMFLAASLALALTIPWAGAIYLMWPLAGLAMTDANIEELEFIVMILPVAIWVAMFHHMFAHRHYLREQRHIRNTYRREVLTEVCK